MAKTNLQQLALCELKLTNLQFTTLNEIADNIKNGKEDYLSVKDALSEGEDKYLRAWLENEGFEVPEEEDAQ